MVAEWHLVVVLTFDVAAARVSKLAYQGDATTVATTKLAATLDDLCHMTVALKAVVAGIRHLGLMGSHAAGSYSLSIESLARYMRLGPSVPKALQLFPAAVRSAEPGCWLCACACLSPTLDLQAQPRHRQRGSP